MARILFYVLILAAGGALAYLVAQVFIGASAPGDVAIEGPYALRNRPFEQDACDVGPYILGLPARELLVGAVTTMFGMIMQSVARSMLRRG